MVVEGTILKLGSHGNLVLEDSDITLVWSIDTDKSKGILIVKNSDFNIYNSTNYSLVYEGSNLMQKIWDYPAHTLLPGQSLKRGHTLVSNSSVTNTSCVGLGLVFFYTISIQEPYGDCKGWATKVFLGPTFIIHC